jgi:hypothetical protein
VRIEVNQEEQEIDVVFENKDHYTHYLDILKNVAYDNWIEDITDDFIKHVFCYEDDGNKKDIIKILNSDKMIDIDIAGEWKREDFLKAIDSNNLVGCVFYCYYTSGFNPSRTELRITKDKNIVLNKDEKSFSMPSNFEISFS